ncbi:hypothetical protein VE03_00235 [Pseudogymnoascus sp. 23342-1-I1]|nr:hypothetical protein VE03_00235 [Pseudogymnoascus sp. 23342-1-I1]
MKLSVALVALLPIVIAAPTPPNFKQARNALENLGGIKNGVPLDGAKIPDVLDTRDGGLPPTRDALETIDVDVLITRDGGDIDADIDVLLARDGDDIDVDADIDVLLARDGGDIDVDADIDVLLARDGDDIDVDADIDFCWVGVIVDEGAARAVDRGSGAERR